MLLVRENGGVVVGRESVPLLTVDTPRGLLDAAHLDGAFLLAEALGARKVSFFHLWHDVACTDDNTAQRDELLDVSGAELSDSVHPAEVVRAHLNDLIVSKLIIVHVIVGVFLPLATDLVHIELFVYLSHNQIKDRDDVGWVVLDLTIEHLIELEDVVAVDV